MERPEGKAKTVLVIEDDRFIGEMYVRSLKKAGYEIDWVVDGADGLTIAKNKRYDIMLIDIMLPNVRGDDILEELEKSGSIAPETKILILTNYQLDTQSRVSLEGKVNAYLIKADITPKKLLAIMDKLYN